VCDFCEELSGASGGEFAARHPRAGSRVVWADTALALLPTLGPLAPRHALVVPAAHVTAFAALPENARRAAEQLVTHFARVARAGGDDVIWFEHGSSGPGSSGGCGVTHAHLHIVPVPAGWSRPRLPARFAFTRAPANMWLDFPPADSDYLLVGQAEDVWAAPVDWLPSQTLRRWLAPAVGASSWDWRSSLAGPHLHDDLMFLRDVVAAAGATPGARDPGRAPVGERGVEPMQTPSVNVAV
jgi:diadenosine tetraphosphate (Ap4A) HIT family hydrolase